VSGVLVLAAHPDDAEMAVGGTIADLVDHGVEVTVAFATVSEADPLRRPQRVAAAQRAADILGHRLRWLADGRHDQVEDMPEYELVRHVDALVGELAPDAVVTHWEGDSHGDHVRLARAVTSSSRRWPQTALLQFGPNEIRTVRYHQFVPNVYVPVVQHLPRKIKALQQYSYEGQGFRPLDVDAVEQAARARGLAVGVSAAEGLLLNRRRVASAVSILS